MASSEIDLSRLSFSRQQDCISPRTRHIARLGLSAVETAITLPVAMLIIFALLDFGLVSVQQNSLDYSARILCREATMHGADADSVQDQWGPVAISTNAGSGAPEVQSILATLPTMNTEDVSVTINWASGENNPGDSVSVTLEFTHDSFLSGWLEWTQWDLRSECAMPIVN
ncbi:TadE/TadG family type IV pilus assembly protein [Roseiconus sp. JC912]